MYISQLDISQLRNLRNLSITPAKRYNYIFGSNGSGKTSLLEAIHLLSLARSFRTTHIKQVISHDGDFLRVFARLNLPNETMSTTIGVERTRVKTRIRVNGNDTRSVADLSSLLPVQIINPDVHKLLELGPKMRRQYIDWGVFHVEHPFLHTWQQYYRVLKQRNAALRKKLPKNTVITWDQQLIELAKKITLSREAYISKLTPYFNDYVDKLLGISVEMQYVRGWNAESTLTETLIHNFEKDSQRGFTSAGPHRADLQLLINNLPVQEVFSRGQHKLLVCAMRLAQISYLETEIGQKCVILVDDLAAELDSEHRQSLLDILINTKAQLFLTATERDSFRLPEENESKMFHVEHGTVKEVIQ